MNTVKLLKKVLLFCSSILCFLIFFTSTSAVCQEKIKINIGWQSSSQLRLMIIRNQGIFEKVGLEANWIRFTAGPPILAAYQSGDVDTALMGYPPTVHGMAAGIDYKIVLSDDCVARGSGLVVPKNSPIKSFSDMKGKKIGTFFGASAHWAVVLALNKFNIKDNEVTLLNLAPLVGVSALASGDVDGIWYWTPWPQIALERVAGSRLVGTSEDVGAYGGCIWPVRTDYIKKNPEAIQRFIKAFDIASSILEKEGRKGAAKMMAEELAISPEISLKIAEISEIVPIKNQIKGHYLSMGTYETRGDSGMAGVLKAQVKFLFERGSIKTTPRVEDFIDTRPAEKYIKLNYEK